MSQWTLALFDKKPPQRFIKLWEDYLKRINQWVNFKVIHFNPSMMKDLNLARKKDFEAYKNHKVLEQSQLICLDEKGHLWTTQKLSLQIESWEQVSQNIVFLIGPSYGLDKSWQQLTSKSWSLSPLTLPHDFAQILLLEQFYRAYSIIKNHPYHCAH